MKNEISGTVSSFGFKMKKNWVEWIRSLLQESHGLLRNDIEKCFEVFFPPRDPISEGAAGERQKRKHQGTPYQVPYPCSEATITCWEREPGPMRSPMTPPRQVGAGRAAALPLSACLYSSLLKAATHRQSCQRICICRMLSGRRGQKSPNPKQQRDGSKSSDRKHLLLT